MAAGSGLGAGPALDRRWAGTYANSVRIYDFDAYPAGFALVLVWRAAARVLLVFVRGTRCRQTQ